MVSACIYVIENASLDDRYLTVPKCYYVYNNVRVSTSVAKEYVVLYLFTINIKGEHSHETSIANYIS